MSIKIIIRQYTVHMIINFKDKLTEDIFNGISSRYARRLPSELHKKAQRKLDMIHAATLIDTLKIPPSNKLAKLTGHLSEYWRIKIDKQWAVIFRWENGNAHDASLIMQLMCKIFKIPTLLAAMMMLFYQST